MGDTWCTIESDPGVFTELIESIGVRGVQVEELYSLDEASFARVEPIYGLVFLFKWTGEKDDRSSADAASQPSLFFARQVIPNACATQAILSVILNCEDKMEIGETLKEFKSFTGEFPPDMKGLAISNSEQIREVHNSFARQEPFLDDGKDDGRKKEDAFHFVAYVPHQGKVYELDGLKPGPIILGDVPAVASAGDGAAEGSGGAGSWLDVASPAIEERISRYSSEEIRFNLMAIVKNRRQVAAEARELCMRRVEAIDAALSAVSSGEAGSGAAMSDGSEVGIKGFTLAQDPDGLQIQRAEELAQAERHAQTVEDEEIKFKQWRMENVRRKHNYVPFVVTLLKKLAEKGELSRLVESAKSKVKERREARADAKKAGQRD